MLRSCSYESTRGAHIRRATHPFTLTILGLGVIAALGCLEEGALGQGGLGGSNVSGMVLGDDFQMYGGVAESNGSGYFITLTDSSQYSCTSTPVGRYLQVSWEASSAGTTSASGNVTFSRVEGNVSPTIGASSGTVTITDIDLSLGQISGSISAMGGESDVSGSFQIEICP